jgi:DNA-binding NtrC family response regulator
METAIAAMRAGAYDFISKPIDLDVLAIHIDRAVKHRRLLDRIRSLSESAAASAGFESLAGTSPAMQRVYDMMQRVTGLDSSILITGESGTGKELVARSLHRHSQRGDAPFRAINCTAIPDNLIESELFGHRKGAFTGAQSDRDGLFVSAHGGTVLLDEIADLPLSLQPKLLRALEERRVRPVGANDQVDFDVRIISATNRDLETMVAEGSFREDLFYRLNVIQLELPPLRSRGNDILLLAERFLNEFATAAGKNIKGLTVPVMKKLMSYPWPGNVRELRNCIERAVAMTEFDKLVVDDLPPRIADHVETRLAVISDDPAELVTLADLEQRYIHHVLDAVSGNKSAAAKVLGLDRKTLYRKLDQADGTDDDDK